MGNNNMVNRRKVLKTTPILVTLSAGCTGGTDDEGAEPVQTEQKTQEAMQESTPQETGGSGDQSTSTPQQGGYEQALADLTEAAQQEGRVDVRKIGRGGKSDVIGAALTEATGIEYSPASGAAEKHVAQSKTEIEVGKLQADLMIASGPSERMLALNEGIIAPNNYPPAVEFGKAPAEYAFEWDDQNRWVSPWMSGDCMSYNTNLVSPDEVPTTFDECLDPRWENSFLIDTDGIGVMHALMQVKGSWDAAAGWLEDFTSQILQLKTSSHGSTVDVANGRAPMFMGAPTSLSREYKIVEELPIDYVFLDDLAFMTPTGYGIFNQAPHRNAAKLFLEYSTKQEVIDEVISKTQNYSWFRDQWPERLKNTVEKGELYLWSVPEILDSQIDSGLQFDEQMREYQRILGVPGV